MSKINKLISNWNKGEIKTSEELKKDGIGSDLIRRYLQGKWIGRIGNKAYKLYSDDVDVYSAVRTMQLMLNKKVRIGGKSSLAYQGYSHFLPQKENYVFIYGNHKEKLPVWFTGYDWKEKYVFLTSNMFSSDLSDFLTEIEHKGLSLKISSPELALFEMLYLIPTKQSFQEAFLITENLRTLRSDALQQLFENCNSVKVKRLALFMLYETDQQYYSSLDLSKIDLGSGKRSVAKGGKYNSMFKITVPENLHD